MQVWRASNRAVLQRVVQERRADRCAADVVSSGTPALEPLHREQILQAVKSPTFAELMPQALRPHGEWVGISVNIIAAAYNTNLVKPDEVPKSFDDLKDPRWKGRLAIEAEDVDWFAAVAGKLGEERALGLFRDIVRTNGMSTRTGHTLLANMVAAGEVPFALTVYSYKPDQLARAGAPIRTLYLPPVVALATGVSVTRCATHPNAAVLFYEFMLRDGQEILGQARYRAHQPEGEAAAGGRRYHADGPARNAGQRQEMDRALGTHRHQAAVAMSSNHPCSVLLAAMLALAATPALAQTRSLAEVAAYQGQDRTQRLIEGAKREGTVTYYTTLVAEDSNPVVDAFKRKYGIDVQFWRGSTEAIVQRALAESRAGRCPADAYLSGPPALEPLHREKMLYPIQSPVAAGVMPQARQPHGEYVGVFLNLFTAAYNSNLVRADEVPKTYEDLKHPRWKGRLAIEADDAPWFAAIVSTLGEELGLALFRDIVRANGMSLRKGHTLLANMVAAGEVPLALTVFGYKSDQLQRAGAPVRTLYLPPVIALATSMSVARCAPHPHAAVLLYDFMIGEAQEILAKRDLVPTNPKVKPLPPVDLTFMDPAQMIDQDKKWNELWERTIAKPQ